jgi:hypothetical protein
VLAGLLRGHGMAENEMKIESILESLARRQLELTDGS